MSEVKKLGFSESRVLLLATLVSLFLALPFVAMEAVAENQDDLAGSAESSVPSAGTKAGEAQSAPTASGGKFQVGGSTVEADLGYGGTDSSGSERSPKKPARPDVYVASRELGVDSKYECADLYDDPSEISLTPVCVASNFVCTARDQAEDGNGYAATETVKVDSQSNSETLLGFDCNERRAFLVDGDGDVAPVPITVTLSDFKAMPVEPLVASAGPEEGWLPVNMVNVLHADSEMQTLAAEVLGVPVEVRAIPLTYHWDLGDGNTIATSKAGSPYPSEEISATYVNEGWYDVTLSTTFSGQFSVAGGEWQDIAGTLEIASDPIPIYSKSLESRLVNGDVPVDEDGDPWVPERGPDTEGAADPEATHREL